MTQFVFGKHDYGVVDEAREETVKDLGVHSLEGELGKGTYYVFDAQILPEENWEDRGQSTSEEEENR